MFVFKYLLLNPLCDGLQNFFWAVIKTAWTLERPNKPNKFYKDVDVSVALAAELSRFTYTLKNMQQFTRWKQYTKMNSAVDKTDSIKDFKRALGNEITAYFFNLRN